jgi:peptidoglycan hydrolase-like protein with peptidoglycan-binding domain
MNRGAVLLLAAGGVALALTSGKAKAAAPPLPTGTDEVPDEILDRVIAAIRTDDPAKMRAEAAKLRKEGYATQAAGLESAALQVEKRRTEQGSSAVGAPRVLKAGMKGEDVRDWQKQLQRDGFGEVKADASFGPLTTGATKEWQAQRGLSPDGIVGPATRAAIGLPPATAPSSPSSPSSPAPEVTISVPGLPPVTLPVPTVTPAPTASPALAVPATRMLKEGVRGEDVKAWQLELRRAGYSQVAADGIFGPVSTAATKAWQAERGLSPDGIVGPATRAKAGTAPIGAPANQPAATITVPGLGGLPPVTLTLPGAAATVAPPVSLHPETWRTMRRGTAGADVAELQTYLNTFAGAGLEPDGKFGPATETAVKAWQLTQGLAVDGVIGPAGKARIAQHLQRGSAVAGELAEPEPSPDVAELAARLAEHLRATTAGREDRALVESFQRAMHLNATGAYGPGTAEALIAFGHVPPRPFYWPQKGSDAARSRYRLALRTQAAKDPANRAALLAAASV